MPNFTSRVWANTAKFLQPTCGVPPDRHTAILEVRQSGLREVFVLLYLSKPNASVFGSDENVFHVL